MSTVSNGLKIEFRHNRQVAILDVYDMRRDTVDAVVAFFDASYEEFLRTQQVRHVLIDISTQSMVLPPYARQELTAMTKRHHAVRGRVAIIIVSSLLSQLARWFINQHAARNQPDLEFRLFLNHAEGLAWVMESIQAPTP